MRVAYLVQNHRCPQQAARLVAALRRGGDCRILVVHDEFAGHCSAASLRRVLGVEVLPARRPARRGYLSMLEPFFDGVRHLCGDQPALRLAGLPLGAGLSDPARRRARPDARGDDLRRLPPLLARLRRAEPLGPAEAGRASLSLPVPRRAALDAARAPPAARGQRPAGSAPRPSGLRAARRAARPAPPVPFRFPVLGGAAVDRAAAGRRRGGDHGLPGEPRAGRLVRAHGLRRRGGRADPARQLGALPALRRRPALRALRPLPGRPPAAALARRPAGAQQRAASTSRASSISISTRGCSTSSTRPPPEAQEAGARSSRWTCSWAW